MAVASMRTVQKIRIIIRLQVVVGVRRRESIAAGRTFEAIDQATKRDVRLGTGSVGGRSVSHSRLAICRAERQHLVAILRDQNRMFPLRRQAVILRNDCPAVSE